MLHFYRFLPIFFAGILCVCTTHVSGQQLYNHAIEAGIYAVHVTDKNHTGFMYQNKYTGFVHPRLGISGSISFLTAAYFPKKEDYATELINHFQKNLIMSDIGLVWMPVRSEKHNLSINGGFSYRTRAETEPTEVYPDPSPFSTGRWVINNQFTKTQDIGWYGGIGYAYNFTPRFATGLQIYGYDYDRGTSVIGAGIYGSYRFDVSKESLALINKSPQFTQWGIKGGLNLSNLWEFRSIFKNRRSFHAGLFFNMPLSERVGFRTELLYAQKGARLYMDVAYPGMTIRRLASIRLHYIDIPLLVSYRLMNNLRVYGGAQGGILAAEDLRVSGGSGTSDNGAPMEISLAGGIRYDYGKYNLDIRYTHGIASIPGGKPNNQVFEISLGYILFKKWENLIKLPVFIRIN